MARNLTRKEELIEDLKIAQYTLRDAELKMSEQWMNARLAEQITIVQAAEEKMKSIRAESAAAGLDLEARRRNVAIKETALTDYLNRGTINKAEEAQAKLLDLVAELTKTGMTVEQIKEQLGL